MNSTPMDFSLHALEARFEMQYMQDEFIGNDGGGGGGADYGYYGQSWGNPGAGEGYVGNYTVASDNSGAMFDDGTYTDGSTGAFPAYTDPSNPDPSCWPTYPCSPPFPSQATKCVVCRC